MLTITFITLLAACGDDKTEPTPWDGMGQSPLIPLHVPLSTTIEGAVAPRRLLSVDSVTAVLDTNAGRIHLLDDRLGHSAAARCLYDERFERFEAGEAQQGDCEEGGVELRRGVLVPVGLPVDFASGTGSGIWVLDHLGEVYFADSDILLENPFDYLRLFSIFDSGVVGASSIAVEEGTVWIGSDTQLHRFDDSGETI